MRHNGSEPDDIRQILAEQDMMAGLAVALRGALEPELVAAADSGVADLRAIMRSYKEPQRTLSEQQAAQWLGIKTESLARLRRRGAGPAMHPAKGGRPRYTIAALGSWNAARVNEGSKR